MNSDSHLKQAPTGASRRALLTSIALLLTVSNAKAQTTLPIVGHYQDAAHAQIWEGIPDDAIPRQLIQEVKIATPKKAFQAPYQNVFLQNDRMVVCLDSCEKPQPLAIMQNGSEFSIPLKGSSNANLSTDDGRAIKAATVYTWINRLMDSMAKIGFEPSKRLIVMIDNEVIMPDTGVRMDNNAFFLANNWSLNFLPIHKNWFSKMVLKMDFVSPAFDPVVAMHEAAHSIFSQEIGPIINSEVMGLHEAFADYLAMDVAEDHRIGLVMGSGHALRSNDTIEKYAPGLEAHKLGAIVASALWQIRSVINDRTLAAKLAFKTLKDLGKDPYISAADVARFHLANVRAEAALAYNPEVGQKIEEIWAKTGMTHKNINIETSALLQPQPNKGYFQIAVRSTLPSEGAAKFGLPKETETIVGLVSAIAGPKDTATAWLKLNVETETVSQPVWILIDAATNNILGSYSIDGSSIQATSETFFDQMQIAKSHIQTLLSWHTGAIRPHVELFQGKGAFSRLLKLSSIETKPTTVTINGQVLPAKLYTGKLKRKALGFVTKAVIGYLDPGMTPPLFMTESLSVLTVDSTLVPNLNSIEFAPGERLVGYSSQMVNGATSSSVLREIDTRYPVLNQNSAAVSQ